MTKLPLVTVIVPTYNRATKISKAIESIFAQTYPHIQIIVVDDGSTDGTANIISSFPSVEYFFKAHEGQAAARNHGLKHSKGKLIATLDTDDIWLPEFLTTTVNKLINEKLDFVFANWLQEDHKGKWKDFLKHYSYFKPYLKTSNSDWHNLAYADLRKLYIQSCPSPSSAVLMRKSSILSGWNEQMIVADDWCLYLDMILNNTTLKVAFNKKILWKKATGRANLMDGRNRLEILQLVYVDDVDVLLNRYQLMLRKSEIQILKKMRAASLIELAKNNFLNNRYRNAFGNLKQAANINVFYAMWAIPNIFIGGLGKYLKQ